MEELLHSRGCISISSLFQSILLSDESSEADSQSEDNDEEEEEEELNLSREELHNMLRLHKYKKLHQNKYSKDKEVRISREISDLHAGYLLSALYSLMIHHSNFIFR